jgi:hypothetical protein
VVHVVQDRTPEPVRAKAAAATEQVRDRAARAGRLARERTPEPVREQAGQGLRAARANRAPLLAAAGALVALLFIRRSRKHR